MDNNKLKAILELLSDNNTSSISSNVGMTAGSKIKIVIYQRGWIAIGNYSEDGEVCILNNAHIIRRWGTTKGLGQLALEGRQEETILEETGTIRALKVTTINTIDCIESRWKKL